MNKAFPFSIRPIAFFAVVFLADFQDILADKFSQ